MPSAPSSDALDALPFIQYYVRQGVFRAEELDAVKATLQAPLPVCFRINPNARAGQAIKDRLVNEFPALFASIVRGGKQLSPPAELAWYPFAKSAWQLDCGRSDFAKLGREHPEVQAFRDFLMHQTAEGNITRQEAVSMIPALLLGIQREHRVLDLCAAPGSKTSQVMEELDMKAAAEAAGKPSDSGSHDSSAGGGFIVANDANEKRSYLLVHQLQRLGLDNAVVTCHLGQDFPGLYDNGALRETNVFDRVICDVPCSGDGTIRKNKNLWRQWALGSPLTLYKVQLELALRAAALLKSGGLMVYSTCSLNPIENESVVAELLRRASGALEVVDASELLPGLVRREGLRSWQVAYQSRDVKHSDMSWFSDYESVPDNLRGDRIPKSMFPPGLATTESTALRHCMRLFPTDQNTGGFFVALLRKLGDLPGERQSGLPSFEDAARQAKKAAKKALAAESDEVIPKTRRWPISAKAKRRIEDAALKAAELQSADGESSSLPLLHQYIKLSNDHWSHIRDFYGIKDHFPHEHLFARSDGAISVCLVNPNVQDACLAGRDLKILNTGIRVFARVQAGDRLIFRPAEEGLSLVLPFITKRTIGASESDVARILSAPLSANGQAHPLESFSDEFQAQIQQMRELSGTGPVVLVPTAADSRIQALPVWIGDKSVVLLADKLAQKRLANSQVV
ncbi:hypothetical protein PybrP1_010532 [[Pythium] brassicae (nom. inval.)]|nr:hypothetical protein PybrP1_010532 [[Pythium] brassicae (nom. inval.)]